jgi:hypothetical protein
LKVSEVQLTTADGQTTFSAEPDETDALAIAREAYAKLTPKQRELTYPSLVQRKELWPYVVSLKKTFDLAGGQSVREGEQLRLVEIQPDKLILLSERLNMTIPTLPQVTDVMAQARTFVENENAGPRFVGERKRGEEKRLAEQKLEVTTIAEKKLAEDKQKALGRVFAELDGRLVNSTTGKPEPLDSKSLPRYIVFYRGSSTCPITREFTPTLIKYYQAMKPKHPEFELIYIMTESVEETAKFATQIGFSWRAIEYENTRYMPTVSQPIKGLLPQLIVMDRNGRVLANGWQNSAPATLRQLDALLKMPSVQ